MKELQGGVKWDGCFKCETTLKLYKDQTPLVLLQRKECLSNPFKFFL